MSKRYCNLNISNYERGTSNLGVSQCEKNDAMDAAFVLIVNLFKLMIFFLFTIKIAYLSCM